MDIELRRRIDELEQQLRSAAAEIANLQSELAIALERQTITAQILNVISMSGTDVQPVFDAPAATRRSNGACDVRRRWHASSGAMHGGKPGQPRGDPGLISYSADILRDPQPSRNELVHDVPLRYRNRTRRLSSGQGDGARQGIPPGPTDSSTAKQDMLPCEGVFNARTCH